MRKYVTNREIEALSSAFIREFTKHQKYSKMLCIDIETFVTEFLGFRIAYESFAEDVPGRIGFLSNGKKALTVNQNGRKVKKIFPENTIVIEKALSSTGEWDRKRFTIAHEAAHRIMEKHFSMEHQAAFHTDYDSELKYTKDILKELLDMNESMTNRMAACLLMPDFLVREVLQRYNRGEPVIVYEGGILSSVGKVAVRKMADVMGVSFQAFLARLRELKLIENRPVREYVMNEYYGLGGKTDE